MSIHNNAITQNGGGGSAGGGISICTGSDSYKIISNWVCGNFNTGDGGGIGHVGRSNLGLIDHNTIRFNQVFDQSANDNGGGIAIESETPIATTGLATGTGSVTITNNIIQGNQAGSGDGGGIALNAVNGAQDVSISQTNPAKWFTASIINNIITDNMAALAGGGISLRDTASSVIVNNTVANNDSTATAAAAFNSPGQSNPQIAGIASYGHSTALVAAIGTVPSHGKPQYYVPYSNPTLTNDIIYDNRQFFFQVNNPTADGLPNYSLQPPSAAPVFSDLGVTYAPTTPLLNPTFSLLSSTAGYAAAATNIINGAAAFHCSYFDQASITTQEVEPTSGIQPQPAFDEGGNYIDLHFGPLTPAAYSVYQTSPTACASSGGTTFYSYIPTNPGSDVVGKGSATVLGLYGGLAATDINGATRSSARTDMGAAQATAP